MISTPDAPQEQADAGKGYLGALIKTVAGKYGKAWPDRHRAALNAYEAYVLSVGSPFKLETVEAIESFVGESAEAVGFGALCARLRERNSQLDEHTITNAAHGFRGIVRRARLCIDWWAHLLTVGVLPIFTPHEIMMKRNACVKDMVDIPPIYIDHSSEGNHAKHNEYPYSIFIVLGEQYCRDVIPLSVQKEFDALITLIESAEIALSPQGIQSEIVRSVYRKFSAVFWGWYQDQNQKPQSLQITRRSTAIINAGEDYLVSMSDVMHAAHCGSSTPLGWQTPEDDFPYKDIGNYQLSLGNYSQSNLYNSATDSRFAQEVANFDPETSLAARYALGTWLKAHTAGALGPNESVDIYMSKILEVEGIEKDKGRRDFTTAQKRRVLDKMKRAACIHIRGIRTLPGNEKREVLGTYLDIITSSREEEGEFTPYKITISPGLAVRQFYTEHPEIGYFFSALAKLKINRPGVDRLAFMIGNYLSYQYQVRRSTGNYDQPFIIGNLLQAAQIEIESNPDIYGRFVTNIDGDLEDGKGAFERLKQIRVIKNWRYKAGDYEQLQGLKYGRFAAWQRCRVIFDPPDIILQRSKVCQDKLEGHIKKAERLATARARRKAKALTDKVKES